MSAIKEIIENLEATAQGMSLRGGEEETISILRSAAVCIATLDDLLCVALTQQSKDADVEEKDEVASYDSKLMKQRDWKKFASPIYWTLKADGYEEQTEKLVAVANAADHWQGQYNRVYSMYCALIREKKTLMGVIEKLSK